MGCSSQLRSLPEPKRKDRGSGVTFPWAGRTPSLGTRPEMQTQSARQLKPDRLSNSNPIAFPIRTQSALQLGPNRFSNPNPIGSPTRTQSILQSEPKRPSNLDPSDSPIRTQCLDRLPGRQTREARLRSGMRPQYYRFRTIRLTQFVATGPDFLTGRHLDFASQRHRKIDSVTPEKGQKEADSGSKRVQNRPESVEKSSPRLALHGKASRTMVDRSSRRVGLALPRPGSRQGKPYPTGNAEIGRGTRSDLLRRDPHLGSPRGRRAPGSFRSRQPCRLPRGPSPRSAPWGP